MGFFTKFRQFFSVSGYKPEDGFKYAISLPELKEARSKFSRKKFKQLFLQLAQSQYDKKARRLTKQEIKDIALRVSDILDKKFKISSAEKRFQVEFSALLSYGFKRIHNSTSKLRLTLELPVKKMRNAAKNAYLDLNKEINWLETRLLRSVKNNPRMQQHELFLLFRSVKDETTKWTDELNYLGETLEDPKATVEEIKEAIGNIETEMAESRNKFFATIDLESQVKKKKTA